ncbi:hypothetical protein BDA96_01G474700 [Sorghum bicolor]|uniref:Uncharacterized protein n=1 Tax=Sorghum bicolor TaxID=4558 RepID=A0A921V1S6_SORBI|nr:hypothetical protein BDA96_01G474700 [Sorghum bicolor]
MAGHHNKDVVSCAGWEIAQGVVFHPWVLPTFVSLCPASCCWLLVLRIIITACCKLNGATAQHTRSAAHLEGDGVCI